MTWIVRPRIWFLLVAVACAALLGYGYYVQHVLFIDPCPLCVLQRLAFIWIGAVSLLAFIHNPAAKGYWVYSGLFAAGRPGRHSNCRPPCVAAKPAAEPGAGLWNGI